MSKEQGSVAEDLEIKNIIEPQLNIILTTDEDDGVQFIFQEISTIG